jgi:hypothetical protein
MKYLLIHGYGIGLQYSFLKSAEGENAGFGAFDDLIEAGEAKVFRWEMSRKLNFWETINVKTSIKQYNDEMLKIENQEVYDSLQKELTLTQPEAIVCHSAGGFLLLRYLTNHILPSSVKKIVFIQSNIPQDMVFPDYLQKKLQQKEIKLINLYCYWDQALWSLVIIGRQISIGLLGSNNTYVKNIFFPLYKGVNLHTSSINDTKIFPFIEG